MGQAFSFCSVRSILLAVTDYNQIGSVGAT